MNPFYSICIPTTDRGNTIYNTLCSVAQQSFRDFELIVVDCGSKDNTRQEIERFFGSEIYNDNKFDYIYETRDYVPKTVEDWNEPVKLARGKYIAMLEGDDQFLPSHLEDAYQILQKYSNIGMYAEGNQCHKREIIGIIEASDWTEYAVSYKDVAPPSEAIFIRLNKDGHPFLYNDIDYEYAPESELYVRISLAGYDAFHSEKTGILRDISIKDRTSWHYFVDRFTLLNMYRTNIAVNTYNYILEDNLTITLLAAKSSRSISNIINVCYNIIKKQSVNCFFYGIILALHKYLKMKRK